MARNSGGGISLIVIVLLAFIIGWFGHQYFGAEVTALVHSAFPSKGAEIKPADNGSTGDTNAPCAQVVTSARNPATGDIKIFPTPCDVPKDWEVIQNDTPGL